MWLSAPPNTPLSPSRLEGGPAEIHRPRRDPGGVRGHADRPRRRPQMPQQGRRSSPNLRRSAQDGGTPCPSPNIPFPDQLRGGRAPEVLRAGPADAALRAHRGGQPRLVPPGGVRDPRPRLRPQVREVSRGDEDEDGWNRRPLQTLWCPSGRWQFKSEGADVGFGVYLKTKVGERQRAGDMAEVFPTQRYNAHMVPEDGSLTCSTPGICESGPNPTPKTQGPHPWRPNPPHLIPQTSCASTTPTATSTPSG